MQSGEFLPDVQLFLRPGIVEFGWGHPDPALLPVADLARAAGQALAEGGWAPLAYGAEQGPGRLIEPLCAWLAGREGAVAPQPGQVFITGGVSQALDLLCTLLTRPGDPVLVEAPTYHLALRIFRDHGLVLIPVSSDPDGLRPDALAQAVADLRRQDRVPRFLYTTPTFGNPTGACLPPERRAAVVALARDVGFPILEDDVYRELWYDAPPPPPLAGLADGATVIRLGSFSKILAPGLRLGWLSAPAEIVQRCVRCGLVDSGGGLSHFAAHVVGAFIELGLLDEQIARLRSVYRERRDVLLAALAQHLGGMCEWVQPGGGFFIWLKLPAGADSRALLPRAEALGVSYVPGAPFYAGAGGARYLRLAFSLLPTDELIEGTQRLRRLLG